MAATDPGREAPGLVDIELVSLTKRYGETTVLDDLSLRVLKGELCCLLGPSGCGKTTTLRILSGLAEPDSGRVKLGGVDITDTPPQRRNLGMVFQNYALFPHMNVSQNVAYGLRRKGISGSTADNRVAEALELVRLTGYQQRMVHQLSGGEQQRVALARSLVTEPKALLLDEPLSNLDARLRAEMRKEIQRIQQTLEMTTVYVTHDQEEALSMADRVVVMNRGVIEQIGTPREVYELPASRFVADFIGRVNFIPGRVEDGSLIAWGAHIPLPSGTRIGGGDVTCGIRPERVRFCIPGEGPFRGRIEDAHYLGSAVVYGIRLDVSGSQRVVLHVEVPAPQASKKEGDVVGLSFDARDMQMYQHEEALER